MSDGLDFTLSAPATQSPSLGDFNLSPSSTTPDVSPAQPVSPTGTAPATTPANDLASSFNNFLSNLTPAQRTGLVNQGIGTVEDLLHGFGIGPGSAQTQQAIAAQQAADNQKRIIVALVVVAVGAVVAHKLGLI